VQILVRFEGRNQQASADLIEEPDEHWLESWRLALTGESTPRQEDSLEFLNSALSKWQLYDHRGRIARSEQDFEKKIENDPHADLLAIIALKAAWWRSNDCMGICQFRRTWRHNLVIDFLAVHPALLGPIKSLSGVGTALLYRAAILAKDLRFEQVWLETTDLSAGYYSRLFGTSAASDVLTLPMPEFYDRIHQRFAGAGTNE
jgi:hypothetical protein